MRFFKKEDPSYKKSYAQSGEDLLVDIILSGIRDKKLSYLDIGAHHPIYLSNTYLFYTKGIHGVCVEPDPTLFDVIKEKRKKDICINAGIGVDSSVKANFYVMSSKTLNTFSHEEAISIQNEGKEKIEKVIPIDLININEVIEKYFDSYPNFVSIDVEGLDFEILKTINFDKYKPEVFCVETMSFSNDRKNHVKDKNLIDYMEDKNYFVFADTYVNTIFVNKNNWFL